MVVEFLPKQCLLGTILAVVLLGAPPARALFIEPVLQEAALTTRVRLVDVTDSDSFYIHNSTSPWDPINAEIVSIAFNGGFRNGVAATASHSAVWDSLYSGSLHAEFGAIVNLRDLIGPVEAGAGTGLGPLWRYEFRYGGSGTFLLEWEISTPGFVDFYFLHENSLRLRGSGALERVVPFRPYFPEQNPAFIEFGRAGLSITGGYPELDVSRSVSVSWRFVPEPTAGMLTLVGLAAIARRPRNSR